MAGVLALADQKVDGQNPMGVAWGNPNYLYYPLAASEYGTGGNSSCNSSLGNAVASSCVFYDVTQGNMDIPCRGSYNCWNPQTYGPNGMLSTVDTSFSAAYSAGTGWDFATGIGTVNVTNLVNQMAADTSSCSTSFADCMAAAENALVSCASKCKGVSCIMSCSAAYVRAKGNCEIQLKNCDGQ
jgi:hypothetical protein